MREKDLTEGLGELADKAEQDHEVQMARAELYKAAKYSIKLHEMLKGVSESEGLEGWVQAKITKASDYLSSVYHHLDYQEADDGAMAPDALDGISSGKAEVQEVSDFKKRELEYELRGEEPKRDPKKRRPYRTPQERIQDANKRNSKKYKESLADKLSEAVAKCSDCGNTSYKTLPEEKQKGVDGKVCWKGYKRMGTKQKGGKTVDNCVKA